MARKYIDAADDWIDDQGEKAERLYGLCLDAMLQGADVYKDTMRLIKEVITYGGVFASIPGTGHEIRTSDLTDDPFDFIKESTNIQIRPLRREVKYRKCTNPVLVISTKYSFKFAYIKASDEEPIFVLI